MEIKTLSGTSIESIVACLLSSFSDYFVKMPTSIEYWKERFHAARVDYEFSFGMFEDDELVGFIINGIDFKENILTAFNTGTGVIPTFRNNKIVDQLYTFSIPKLKEKGVKVCTLEVIDKNEKAIRVYERIGFKKVKKYLCFQGTLNWIQINSTIKEFSFETLNDNINLNEQYYSWDNSSTTIKRSKHLYKYFKVFNQDKEEVGFFIINTLTGYLPQFEIFDTLNLADWDLLFQGVSEVSKTIKINNVDESRTDLIKKLLNFGLINIVEQFEMVMEL